MRKKLNISLLFCLAILFCIQAEAKEITLQDVVKGAYYGERLKAITPRTDGEHYTQLSDDGKQIRQYSFASGKQDAVLFDVAQINDCPFKKIDGYILSPDEKKILLRTETKKLYRRSYTAVYYIYYIGNKQVERLSDGGPQECPVFSPNGNLVAFVRENNIFLVKLLYNNSESQVTKDGEAGKILNGKPDWVYEEEFSYNRSLEFSPDNEMLCWTRWDESQVGTFTLQYFAGEAPRYEQYNLYPGLYSYKYHKAGTPNSKVCVQSFDIKSRVIRTLNIPLQETDYVPRIRFTKDANQLAVMVLNRNQTEFNLYMVNPRSGISKLILRDNAKYYIWEKNLNQIRFYDNNFSYLSEKDGYNHLYWYSLNGTLIKQVTKGSYEVSEFYGWDEKSGTFYYRSNEGDPLRTGIYGIDGKGKTSLLSPQTGTNYALFSANLDYFIDYHSSLKEVPTASLYTNKGKKIATLLENKALKQSIAELTNLPTTELFSFNTPDGTKLNGWMMKPANFNPSKHYPVILYQYSGPKTQEVTDTWELGFTRTVYGFDAYMTTQGYIIVCVDSRGTGGQGADFSGSTYMKLGVLEADDQIATARYLSTLPYIDKGRIGIWGWSFGGTTALMSMLHKDHLFKTGIAIAPVTDWKYYDTAYGERYMRTPQENPDGYKAASAFTRAGNLEGNLLICHGLADDNVHYQNTAELSEHLVQLGKQFDMQIYTNRNHGISGGNTTPQLFTRIRDYFKQNL